MKWLKRLLGLDSAGSESTHEAEPCQRVASTSELRVSLPAIDPGEPEYNVEVPPPAFVAKHLEHYSQTSASLGPMVAGHVQRMLEIFVDSIHIALDSKKPDTAQHRYELAIATYYEFQAHVDAGPGPVHMTRLMKRTVALYPAMSRVNEAIGYLDRAEKLATARGKKKWIDLARAALDAISKDAPVDHAKLAMARRRIDEVSSASSGDAG